MTNLNSPQEVDDQNNESLLSLAWEIENSQGKFQVMLAHCNYGNLRKSMKQELQKICSIKSIKIDEFSLQESSKNIYTPIVNYYQTKSSKALMVVGLESVSDLEPILKDFNSNRESFQKNLPCPMVLWVNDQIQVQMRKLALDFKTWATITTFEVDANTLIEAIKTQEKQLFSCTLNAGSGKFVTNNLIFYKDYQLELESALRDLKNCGYELTEQIQASIEFFQGREDYASGITEEALKHYQKSLDFWHKNQLLKREGIVLFDMGLCYLKQPSKLTRDESLRQARGHFEECLKKFEQAEQEEGSSNNLVAKFINQLCEVLQQTSDYYRDELAKENQLSNPNEASLNQLDEERQKILDELDKISQISLALQRLNFDPLREAEAYKFITYVAEQKENLRDANNSAKKGLEIINNLQNIYLLVMAKVQAKLDQKAAIQTLEKARENGLLDDPELYIRILETLWSFYFETKDYLQAFKIKQERRSIQQQFGQRTFIGAGCLQPQQQVGREQGEVALEIKICRQQDMDELKRRIKDRDHMHKLTILHGLSGVGKSSIICAGLIPALEQDNFQGKQCKPEIITTSPAFEKEWIDDLKENLKNSHYKNSDYFYVLIFDNFEFYLLNYSQKELESIYELIKTLLQKDNVGLIISIGEDHLSDLLDLGSWTRLDILSQQFRYRLEDLTKEDAMSLLTNLVKKPRLNWEQDLIEEIVKDLSKNSGKVRPIELQLLGMIIQDARITRREEYEELKKTGIESWLDRIIKDCGTENEKIAQIVLYLLTISEKQNDICPQKTRNEIEDKIEIIKLLDSENAELVEVQKNSLDVVLEVLVGWAIVKKIMPKRARQVSMTCSYQLANETLNEFVQKMFNRDSHLTELAMKLRKPETELRKAITNQKIVQLNSKAWALFLDNDQLEALSTSVEAGKTFLDNEKILDGENELKEDTTNNLRQIYSAMEETNRLTKHTGNVNSVTFSPDGQLIASASADRTIRLWSREGEEIKILNGHKDWVRDVCFSPDGQLIASASADRTIRLWSREGEEIKIAPMEHQDRVNSISFSPDGKIIVSSSDDHTIKLWDINRDLSEEISVSLRQTFFKHALDHQDGHSGSVNSAIFSPPNIRYGIHDQIIASASDDETIKLWSLDGKCLATLKGHQGIVRWATFSQNGQLLASASDDYTVKIWGIDYTLVTNSDGKTDCKINGTLLTNLQGHHDWVWDVNFSFISDSKLLASASDDNSIKLWNLDVQFPQNMQAHQEKVWAVSFSSDSQFLATASSDKTVKIWNLEEKKLLKTLDEHTDWVWAVNFSPDGKFLASGGGDKSLKIWKVGESISEISLIEDINIQNHKYTNYAHKDCICCVKFSPNSQLLASASADNTIKLWDIKGNCINTLKGHEDKVYSIYFSSDGEKIISVSADKTIKLWSCSTGEEIKTFCGHKEWVNYATFSPDDQYIASASNDNTIRIWDMNGKSKIIGRHRGKVWSVRFINEKTLVSASEDKTLKLWTLKEGFWKLEKEEVGIMQPNPIKGISNKITNVKLSPNRKILAAPTNDGIIQIWNIEKLKIEPLELNSLLNKGEDWLNNYRRSRVEQPPPQ
ncbi:MAG: hypothetical protein O9295_26540 [Microcystis sp. LE18-22.4A]|jgi:WD40 repeat protein|uniref:WD40 domain-containing protein n=1 Tax=Microcystis sp. LE18-22.4A TaxID=3016432 RepID=UPI0022BE22F6|nr:hypothetical protein [Microcystis sp. LE18-22.4A]MCZ8121511.1 hypothetical protein [Microcystis sp. LE18-22.4A]